MLCSTSPTRTEEPSVERCLQNKMTFQSRTISVVKDLSLEEQIFLYEKTRELKNVLRASDGCSLEQFKIKNTGIGVYLIFMENSTRTKESFRNAALFHECKMNIFDSATSSFQKGETITDTLKMLCGYSHHQSVFILRTRLEGVCTAMRDIIGDYCDKMGLPRASFINAGDGKHEHPTQEFLDEFTFLEHNGWDRSRIHVALVGDLLHGRTVHSKVEGLRIYDAVHVDLVAPPELSMPSLYVDAMKRHHFTIRTFPSIDAYLVECGRDGVAPMWYFTRLQIERMGEDILSKESTLRRSITFREELYEKVDPIRTRFYHPLPRHAKYPEIPPYLDTTPLNGWEEQSMNGYFTRIIELAMVAGVFDGEALPSLSAKGRRTRDSADCNSSGNEAVVNPPFASYIREVTPHRSSSRESESADGGMDINSSKKDANHLHIKQITDGIVIDHIGQTLQSAECIWHQMDNIHRILGLYGIGSEGVFPSKNAVSRLKGLMSFPKLTIDNFTPERRKMLAAIAPGCTLNVIEKASVTRKFLMDIPPRIYNFSQISCLNPECVSNRKNNQNVMVYFERAHGVTYRCRYCEWEHLFSEIWSDESEKA